MFRSSVLYLQYFSKESHCVDWNINIRNRNKECIVFRLLRKVNTSKTVHSRSFLATDKL